MESALVPAACAAIQPRTALVLVRSSENLFGQGAQFYQAVTVARSCGVGRNLERLGNLAEGQTAPNFEGDDLAIYFRQMAHGFLDQQVALTFVHPGIKPALRAVQMRCHLSIRPPII